MRPSSLSTLLKKESRIRVIPIFVETDLSDIPYRQLSRNIREKSVQNCRYVMDHFYMPDFKMRMNDSNVRDRYVSVIHKIHFEVIVFTLIKCIITYQHRSKTFNHAISYKQSRLSPNMQKVVLVILYIYNILLNSVSLKCLYT